MMKQKHFVVLTILLTFSLLLSACSQLSAATPDPAAVQSTVDAAVAQTLQVVLANITSTAAAMPTSTECVVPTPLPTYTATAKPAATVVIPTVANTVVPVPPTATATSAPAAYTCKLVTTLPAAGTKIKVNTDFDASWKVQNIGTHVWEVGYLDLRYISGTKMQTGVDIFDVTTAVPLNGELTLIVDMRTPTTAGKYTASWALAIGGTAICTLPVDIEAIP